MLTSCTWLSRTPALVMRTKTGRVLAGYFNDPTVYLYDPSANTWTPLPNKKLRQDSTAEEAWV